jgi:hypothetical protein
MIKALPAVLILLAGAAEAQDAVHYNLRISNAAQHTAEVSARFPASAKADPIVQLPNWRTGRYEILPLANGLRQDFIKPTKPPGSWICRPACRLKFPMNCMPMSSACAPGTSMIRTLI